MNILCIALRYHDYTENIAGELRRCGHQVSVRDIMPRDFATKTLRILSPAMWQSHLDRLHARILRAEREQSYDMVLFIQAHQMSLANLAAFREAFAGRRFALYYWDSISNHDYRAHLPYFDDVSTFDPDDAREHGLHYLPLFCSRQFQNLAERDQADKRVYFVGNVVTPQRYRGLEAFRRYASANTITFEEFAACTPPARRILREAGLEPRGLRFGSIPHADFIAMIERSVATFDFANHRQSGFTMRVIENLCAGKKIVTGNARIAHEAFYSPDRIHIFEDCDFSGVRAFLDAPLSAPEEDFPEFHIQAFARHLLDGTGHPLPAGRHPRGGDD